MMSQWGGSRIVGKKKTGVETGKGGERHRSPLEGKGETGGGKGRAKGTY